MLYYSLKRLLQAIPLLLGIATITFFIVHLAPGDPMDMFLNPQFAKGRGLDADIELALIEGGMGVIYKASWRESDLSK